MKKIRNIRKCTISETTNLQKGEHVKFWIYIYKVSLYLVFILLRLKHLFFVMSNLISINYRLYKKHCELINI